MSDESKEKSEAPRSQGGALRALGGEQKASKGTFILIVPRDPAYSDRSGRGTCRSIIESGPKIFLSHPSEDLKTGPFLQTS